MSDVIKHTKKICGMFEKAGHLVKKMQNGINISGNVLG